MTLATLADLFTLGRSRHRRVALLLAALALAAPLPGAAQVNPEIASCGELKDEATVTQADLCAAHIGCRFVLNIQKTCARAKGYLERLRAAMAPPEAPADGPPPQSPLERLKSALVEGRNTLFGSPKGVTPDAVFAATLGDESRGEAVRSLGGDAAAQRQAQDIGKQVREAWNTSELTGKSPSGKDWVYYGQARDGQFQGLGTVIYSDGEVQRGEFKDSQRQGQVDILLASGSRRVGKEDGSTTEGLWVAPSGAMEKGTNWKDGTFIGTRTEADGSSFVGRMEKGKRVDGTVYRADGSVTERGRYENGVLSVGERLSADGTAVAVNVPAERQAAARAAAEQKRLDAEAAQQRQREAVARAEQQQREEAARAAQQQREAAARAEQQFRDSLQNLNAGQLFARADELSAQGDSAHAREVRRALISRFPDHALAAAAARQMAGDAAGGASTPKSLAGDAGRPAPGPSASSKESSKYSSVCMRNAAKAEQAINAAKAMRYFGGAVDLEIFDMVKRISQPCMAYDPKAKWAYDDAEQARVNSVRWGKASAPRWPEGEQGVKTRQWFEIFSGEFNKMMANWDHYSRDLDPPGAVSQDRNAPPRSTAGRLSSQTCEAMKQNVIATQIPPNATITASQETVMFMTKTTIDMIDGGCPTEPGVTPAQIAAERQQRQQQYKTAESACNQVQSGGRLCTPSNHFGPGTSPGAGLQSPYPQIPVPIMKR